MNIRPYQAADIEQLLTLWWDSWHSSASFLHHKQRSEWKNRWLDTLKNHSVVVIESNGALLGFAALDANKAELSQIFVAPNAKRQGIGKILFNWAVSVCPDGFTLKTLVENSESRAFYISRGMVESGFSVNDFNGHKEIRYSLKKQT